MHKILPLLLFFCFSSAFAQDDYIKIGVIAYRGVDKTLHRWQPTVDFLQEKLPQHKLVLIPLNLHQIQQAIIHNELDFTFGNPGLYYEMKKYGVEPLTSIINEVRGKGYDQFGAIIFTRSDRADINSLNDTKGKQFVAVDRKAFGGFQMAWREFKKVGIDPMTDFSQMKFTGFPMDDVVLAIRDGKADVGTVRTDILEYMEDVGIINISDYKILNQKKEKDFPFLLSTPLYPDWLFAKTKSAPRDLSIKLRNLLHDIKNDSKAAIQGKYIGWTSEARMEDLLSMSIDQLIEVSVDDNKYKEIDVMMKELSIGPYSDQ